MTINIKNFLNDKSKLSKRQGDVAVEDYMQKGYLKEALINYVADQFKADNGVDLRKDTMALQRLQEACEKAKKELSSVPSTDLNLPFITADANGPKHLQVTITKAKFEELIDDLVTRCRKPVEQALSDAGFSPSDIDEVVLESEEWYNK